VIEGIEKFRPDLERESFMVQGRTLADGQIKIGAEGSTEKIPRQRTVGSKSGIRKNL
jgi:hypothetical protein